MIKKLELRTKSDTVVAPITIHLRGKEVQDPAEQPLILCVPTLDTIRTERIASVTVLKDSAALQTYGEEGKNGVIFVTLPKEEDPERGNISISQVSVSGSVPGSVDPDSANSHGFITITGKPVPVTGSDSGLDGNPVIVVDGERYEGSLNDLDVQRIESMSIYKSNIPEKYRAWVGPDNEGVIEIVTQPLGETKSGYVVLPEGSLDEAQQKMSAYFNSDEWKEAQQTLEMLSEMDLEGSVDGIRILGTKFGEVSGCNTVLGATGGAMVTGPDVMSKTRSTDDGTVTVVKGRVTADFSQISEARYRIELNGKPAAKSDLVRLEPGVIKTLELSTLTAPGKKGVLRVRTRR